MSRKSENFGLQSRTSESCPVELYILHGAREHSRIIRYLPVPDISEISEKIESMIMGLPRAAFDFSSQFENHRQTEDRGTGCARHRALLQCAEQRVFDSAKKRAPVDVSDHPTHSRTVRFHLGKIWCQAVGKRALFIGSKPTRTAVVTFKDKSKWNFAKKCPPPLCRSMTLCRADRQKVLCALHVSYAENRYSRDDERSLTGKYQQRTIFGRSSTVYNA